MSNLKTSSRKKKKKPSQSLKYSNHIPFPFRFISYSHYTVHQENCSFGDDDVLSQMCDPKIVPSLIFVLFKLESRPCLVKCPDVLRCQRSSLKLLGHTLPLLPVGVRGCRGDPILSHFQFTISTELSVWDLLVSQCPGEYLWTSLTQTHDGTQWKGSSHESYSCTIPASGCTMSRLNLIDRFWQRCALVMCTE